MDLLERPSSPSQSSKRLRDDAVAHIDTLPIVPVGDPIVTEPDTKRTKIAEEPVDANSSDVGGSNSQIRRTENSGRGKAKDSAKGKWTKKGGKNTAERQRVRNRNEEDAAGGAHRQGGAREDGADGSKQRFAKRRVALLISFCGTGLSGMQFQHTSEKTIEGYLFHALVKSGAISQDNSDHPAKVDLQRAARTDAGVHAAGNVVSLKMIVEPPLPGSDAAVFDTSSSDPTAVTLSTPEQLVSTINSFLPPQIRLWSFLRTRGTFNARKECDSRRYEYLFPSWMLLPPKPGSNLSKTVERSRTEADLPPSPIHPFWVAPTSPETQTSVSDDLARKRAWRAEQTTIDRFNEVLKMYHGTHCFHNYTVGREFSDRAAQRYMMRVEVRGVNVLDGVEWVSVLFHGQSFMLHQIRKMISMAIMACRTDTPLCLIPETYGPRRIILPMAPALGLLLEQPVFGSYNDRVNSENAALDAQKDKLSADEMASRRRDGIDFDQHQEGIDKFKLEQIYDRMREEEAQSNVFDRWLRLIDAYQGEDLAYFNCKGSIPQSAVVKKGERRSNGLKEFADQQRSLAGEEAEDTEAVEGLKGKELEEMEG